MTPENSAMTNDPSSNPERTDDPGAEAIEAAEEIRQAASAKAREIRDAAAKQGERFREMAQEQGAQLRDAAAEQIEDSRERVDQWKREGERYVRAHPAKSVLIALGLGFLIGRIFK